MKMATQRAGAGPITRKICHSLPWLILAGFFQIGHGVSQVLPRLDWGTYHGGSSGETFRDLYADKAGYTYVIGSTMSPNGISTPGSHQPMSAGGPDVFVAKYSPAGTRLWATYFGGPDADQGQHITLDTAGGFLYITGFTSSPTGMVTAGAYQGLLLGSSDAFLAKFDTSGTLIWSTYFGGSEGETCNAVAVDPAGNVTITGWTNSPDNIASPGAHLPVFRGQQDIFIAQFDSNGARRWSTYYGDIGFDIGLQVAADANSNLIISGWTSSAINIASPGASQPIYAGGTADAYLLKFSPNGTRIWSTYFGGTLEEYGDALYLAPGGDIFLAGPCTSPDGLSTTGTHQPAIGGNYDGFVARFDAAGNPRWGTYYGGNDIDVLYGITGGPDDAVIIAGHTRSTSAISTIGAQQETIGGDWDAFIAQLDGNGRRVWASYYGGIDEDQAFGVATDSVGYVYLTGYSFSPNQISTPGAAQENSGGNDDGYVARFAPCTDPTVSLLNGGYRCSGANIALALEFSGIPPFTLHWSIDGVVQPPLQSDTTSLFYFINGSLWQDSIVLLGVSSGPCMGTLEGPFPWIRALAPISADSVTIDCDPASQTYTVSGNLSGNAFGFLSVGGTPVLITANSFITSPLPFPAPYSIGITSGLRCDTILLSGLSGCTVQCPQDFGFIRPDTAACQGSDIPLFAGGGLTYSWSGPNGFMSTLPNPVISNAMEADEGFYVVTITDANGCRDTISTLITILSVNGTISTEPSVCLTDSILLFATGGIAYAWSGPDNFSSSLPNPVIPGAQTTQAGTYSVTITDSQGCSLSLSTDVSVVPPPAVMVSGNSPLCEGSTLTLRATGGTTYAWSGPQGFVSISATPSLADIGLSDAGIYRVTVSNGGSCVAEADINIVVLDGPEVLLTSNQPLCPGNDLLLSGSGADSYNWSGPAGFTSTVQSPIIASVDATAGGTYILEGINNNGCRDTTTGNVLVYPRPLAIVTPHPDPYCEGSDVLLQVNAASSYSWSGPGGFTSAGQSPLLADISLLAQGFYGVTVTDANGCTNEGGIAISVVPNPDVVIDPGAQAYCEGDDLLLMLGGDPAVYTWSTPSGITGMGQMIAIPGVTLASGGWYSVTATSNGIGQCVAIDSVNITVYAHPVAAILGPDTLCAGASATLTATGGTTYAWSSGQTTATITDIPPASTLYEVIVIENNCPDTADFLVHVKPLPAIDLSAPAAIDIGTSVLLLVTGADTYQWSPAIGLSCTSCANPSASPVSTITYCVTGFLDGCAADTCVTILVRDECQVDLPNIFSPNFDRINDEWCSALPVCAEEQRLTIFDRWGGVLFHVTGQDVCWDGFSNGKPVNPGVYVYLLALVRRGNDPFYLRGEITLLR